MNAATQVSTTSTTNFSGRKIRTASIWVFGGYITGQILRLASNLLMTRLLAPEMFGVMAIANVVIVGVQMLTDMGIQQSIIQSRSGSKPVFLNTAWSLQILRGCSLAAIVCGLALALGLTSDTLSPNSVLAQQDLPVVIAILAISLVVGGFRSTKSAIANRELSLGRMTAIELIAQLIALATMIFWAIVSPTIWALVAGTLMHEVAKICLEYILLPGANNKLQWNRQFAGEIFHFGKWVFATSLLSFWVMNGDRLIMGVKISAYEMGVYSIAIFIIGAIRGVLNSIMRKVMYPSLSQTIRGTGDFLSVYYRFRLPLDFLIVGVCGFLIVSGNEIINILYDERYRQAGLFLSLLSVSLIADRYRGLGFFFQAQGKPKMMLPVALARATVLSIGLPLSLYYYQFVGAIAFLGFYPLAIVPLQLYMKYRAGLFCAFREITYTLFLIPGFIAGHIFNILILKFF